MHHAALDLVTEWCQSSDTENVRCNEVEAASAVTGDGRSGYVEEDSSNPWTSRDSKMNPSYMRFI